MERYEAYKDSGVKWLGKIPVGWEIKKLKYGVSKVGSGITPSGGASIYQLSGIPLLRSQNIHVNGIKMDDVAYIDEKLHDSMSSSKVQAGDVLLNITGASIGRCFYVEENFGEANVNQHVCIIRPNGKIKTSYLYFVLRSCLGQEQIKIEQTGSGREGLNFEALNNFIIPYLSVGEQTAIADFLDRKTAEIDALIAQKERLLELYEEEKTAITNHAVTKGLDPNAELKDSRVAWLGEIPVGWGIVSLKWKSSIYAGGTPDKERLEYWLDGTIPWLNSGAVNQFIITEPSDFITAEGFRNSSAKWIDKDSIVVALAGQGKTKGMAALTTFRTTCNQSLSVIQPASDIDSRYLLYYLRANYLNIRGLAGEGKRDGLNLEMIGGIPISVPPLEEQTTIANFLDRKMTEIDAKITKTQRIIELQKEYRTALISEVVTGKIKVPELPTQEASA